ncbi:hypothetical protein GOV03_00030 [Candidatus Woesearchaeota archaeon]|nr:hypothetical protein [Candidatus Woesearchaeota archaeon]
MDTEHGTFPHKILEDLKYDIEALKKKLSEPEAATQELVIEMEDLKSTLKELHGVFKEALQDIKEDDSIKLLNSLQNKIETVTTQNETIARGMIAISEKLEEFMRSQGHSSGLTPRPPMPPPLPPHLTSPGMSSPEKPHRRSIFK